eukprot:TRINITY_DN5407_c0_g1_i1.p1 TRINITY_DN5407_c0_g1~~TRINITY_DN5407_c0_g1_i1.p1  ORF type:complete len:441 (-),score=177.94 TRINITY_DN5407_c0_g1_i1:376-1698(-)
MDSIKVCGLCAQIADTSVDMNEDVLGFLSEFFSVDPSQVPSTACSDCFSCALDTKRFKEATLKAMEKTQKISPSLVLGSSCASSPLPRPKESLQVRIPLTERVVADRKFKAEGCTYPKSNKAPPRKRPSSAAAASETPPRKKERDDLDCPEVFPSVGPYQCEICFIITDTKHEFVSHIKDNHRHVVDDEVLDNLELDLKKVERKMSNTSNNSRSSKQTHSSQPQHSKKAQQSIKKKKRRPSSLSKASPLVVLPNGLSNGEDSPREGINCPKCSTFLQHRYNLKKHFKSKVCSSLARGYNKGTRRSSRVSSALGPVEDKGLDELEEEFKKKEEEKVKGQPLPPPPILDPAESNEEEMTGELEDKDPFSESQAKEDEVNESDPLEGLQNGDSVFSNEEDDEESRTNEISQELEEEETPLLNGNHSLSDPIDKNELPETPLAV